MDRGGICVRPRSKGTDGNLTKANGDSNPESCAVRLLSGEGCLYRILISLLSPVSIRYNKGALSASSQLWFCVGSCLDGDEQSAVGVRQSAEHEETSLCSSLVARLKTDSLIYCESHSLWKNIKGQKPILDSARRKPAQSTFIDGGPPKGDEGLFSAQQGTIWSGMVSRVLISGPAQAAYVEKNVLPPRTFRSFIR